MNGGLEIVFVVVSNGEVVVKFVDFIKEGYIFDGWFVDVDKIIVFDFLIIILSDIIIYVKWNVSFISIVVNINGVLEISVFGFGFFVIFIVISVKNSVFNLLGIFIGGLRVYNGLGGDGGFIIILIDFVYVILFIKVNIIVLGYLLNIKFIYVEIMIIFFNYYLIGVIVNNINVNFIIF